MPVEKKDILAAKDIIVGLCQGATQESVLASFAKLAGSMKLWKNAIAGLSDDNKAAFTNSLVSHIRIFMKAQDHLFE